MMLLCQITGSDPASLDHCLTPGSTHPHRSALLICCQSFAGVHEQEITMSASRRHATPLPAPEVALCRVSKRYVAAAGGFHK